jgi:hypothetical protein
MGKKFRHRGQATRFLMTGAEDGAPHFQSMLHLAHEQVVLVLVMKIKSGAPDLGAIEHFPNGNVIDRLFLNQADQGGAEPLARAADAEVSVDLTPSGFPPGTARMPLGGLARSLLDIDCPFVQQLGRALDLPAFHRYIAYGKA